MPHPRPEPGTKTTREIRVCICKSCGYTVSDNGLCDGECKNDADHHRGELTRPVTYFHAVYERTDVFLRDEEATQ